MAASRFAPRGQVVQPSIRLCSVRAALAILLGWHRFVPTALGKTTLSPASHTNADTKSAEQILDETFLVLRSKLIDIAANLDRIDRCAASQLENDPRIQKIAAAIRILNAPAEPAERAKQLQLLFSRTYESKWRSDFNL